MRSGLFRLATTSAAVLSGIVALASIAPAHAQPKPAAKPAAAQPAKPAAKPAAQPAKPAAQPAKPAAKPDAKAAAKPDPKAAAKPDPKAAAKPDPKAAAAKLACAAEPKKNLPDSKKKDEAKKAFGEGKTRFDKADYENSLACFKLADAYVPGAQPKYRVAASHDKLGHVAEAVAAYEAFLAFVGPTPDDKFKEIVADAKTRHAALKATPSKVKIATTPAALPNMKVTVDGVAQPGLELTLAPGKHTVVVSADGYDASTQQIEVGFAETRDVSVTLNKAAEPVATVAPTATAAPTTTAVASAPTATATATTGPVQPPTEKSNIPAYVTLGLAGAGAVVGGIFGGLALSSKSDFDKTPTVEKADETDRNALIADMSFAVALTFGVTGAVLLLTDTGSSTTAAPAKTGTTGPQKSAKKPTLPRGFVAAPYASPNGGGAAARFTF